MRELFSRLLARPGLLAQLLLGTFFVNVLNFFTSLYVMLVLNRYLAHGAAGTLVTLTAGMLFAVALLFCFEVIRRQQAAQLNAAPNESLLARSRAALLSVSAGPLLSLPQPRLAEMAQAAPRAAAALGAETTLAVLDLPFVALFLLAVFLLSPLLGLLVLLCNGLGILLAWTGPRLLRGPAEGLRSAAAAESGLLATALAGIESLRVFRGRGLLDKKWSARAADAARCQEMLEVRRGLLHEIQSVLAVLMRVVVTAFGAVLVVKGDLTIGAMIGASLLGSTALGRAFRFNAAAQALAGADRYLAESDILCRLPAESTTGASFAFAGGVRLTDVGLAYPGQRTPLFESLSLDLAPGEMLVVTGPNGSGKTTLARLFTGLLEPSRGAVGYDGVDLRQVDPAWRRSQLVYLPQESGLLDGNLLENIVAGAHGLDPGRIRKIVRAVGLARFLDALPEGIKTQVGPGGRDLPRGVRRRVALARALVVDGPLVVLDEPFEAMDAEGRQCVRQIIRFLRKRGRTVVLLGSDPGEVEGADWLLDLSVKPRPVLQRLKSRGPAALRALPGKTARSLSVPASPAPAKRGTGSGGTR